MKTQFLFFMFFISLCTSLYAQGFYIEYNISGEQGISGTMKSYSLNNNTRSEMNMVIKGMPGGEQHIVTIILAETPDKIHTLNENSKTYSISEKSSSPDMNDAPQNDYEVTVIGKEKAVGYNVIHVKVKQKSNQQEQELWLSTEIQGFADFIKMKTSFTGKDNLYKALAVKNVNGFPVKIKVSEHGSSVVHFELNKAEKRTVSADMFSLTGYTKSASSQPVMQNGQMQNQQELINQMQNMTPEQREQMIKQMQQQYGNPH